MSISSASNHFKKLISKAEAGKDLSRKDIIQLLKLPGNYLPDLFAAADRVRKEQVGDS